MKIGFIFRSPMHQAEEQERNIENYKLRQMCWHTLCRELRLKTLLN